MPVRGRADWTTAPPLFNECVSTNTVYHDANGELECYTPDDPRYQNPADPRPWASVFERAERAQAEGR